jgi:hypothetical protein
MDIMELGAIGELVGGVAVIGSPLYVGLQVRQSNRHFSRSSFHVLHRQLHITIARLEA